MSVHDLTKARWIFHGPALARLGCAALFFALPGPAAHAAPGAAPLQPETSSPPVPAWPSAAAAFAALPLAFEPLAPPADATALFLARGPNYQFKIGAAEAQIILCKSSGVAGASLQDRASLLGARSVAVRTVRMRFAGANSQARTFGQGARAAKVNYLVGSDPAQWRTGIETFGCVRVEDLYPGVGLVYHGNQQRLEYDFLLAPGADPATIAVQYEGADRLTIDSTGELVLGLGPDEIRQPPPVLYQAIGDHRIRVAGSYQLKDPSTVTFSVGAHDWSLPLVIDPTLNYSTFFGGNSDDIIWAVKVNPADNSIFLAGQTLSSQFPFALPAGGYQATNQGGSINGDAFVAKLDATGTNLLFFTFLGGSGDDGALDLALDPTGHAYVTGYTDSTNFPFWPLSGGVPGLPHSTNLSGAITPAHVFFSDAFVAELTPNGDGLVFSTYLGGSDRDAGIGIALDSSNYVYVTGYTYSTNFFTTNALVVTPLGQTPPLRPTWFTNLQGSNDVFVTKFAPGGTRVVYSTYLGGTNYDVGQGIAADTQGNAYITGYTASTNFPVTAVLGPLYGQLNDTTNAVRTYSGTVTPAYDAFVAKIAPLGSNLLYCAYLGGTNNDAGFRIRLDAAGAIYVAGSSYSVDFPIVPAATTNLIPYGRTNVSYINSDAFLTKIVAPGNVPVIQYSLLFGGPGDETAWDLALDPVTTNIFLVGNTTSTNFPTFPNSATNAPFLQPTNYYTRSNDVFVAAFGPAVCFTTNYVLTNSLLHGHLVPVLLPQTVTNQVLTNLYAVSLGGLRDDFGLGIDVDATGNAFVVGQTLSGDFPALDALQPALVGSSDGFLARIQFADALVAVTIATIPPNLPVIVDGATNTAPFTTNWVVRSLHSLATISPQTNGVGAQNVWAAWSDDGFLSHQVAPPAAPAITYTAHFTPQFFLTMKATTGGAVYPPSGWYDADSVVPISATPALGATFAGWTAIVSPGDGSGAYVGPNNQARVTVDGPFTETANFTGALSNRVTVVTNGPGSVLPNLNGQTLRLGSSHTITASPNPGNIFTGWTGAILTNIPTLTFVMSNGLILQANFATNLFAPFQGANYAGLFFAADDLEFESSGYFTATLAGNGAFSATLRVAGSAYSLGGQFAADGTFSGTIGRGSTLPSLLISLELNLSAGNRLTGQISDGVWTADLLANRAVFSYANPAPERGKKYLVRFPGSGNSLAAPGGDGFGTVTVDPTGALVFSGTLSDGSGVSQSTFVSGAGDWPFYVALYSGQGAILGRLTFTGAGANSISGPVSWFKLPAAGVRRPYPGGFTVQTNATGAAYAFTSGTRGLNFSQGRVVLEMGGLAANITNAVSVDANNHVRNLTPANPLNFNLNASAGLFSGSFINPATGQTLDFSGALLQLQNLTNGTGFFLTTNQSGRVCFGP